MPRTAKKADDQVIFFRQLDEAAGVNRLNIATALGTEDGRPIVEIIR